MAATIQFKTPALCLNPLSIKYYDFLATVINKLAWRCPQEILKDDYRRYVGNNHLEVGAKTGKMLDHLNKPVGSFRLTLVDLNLWSLRATKKRLARYTPNVFQLNIFDDHTPIPELFDSISVNRVLHCIPQGFYTKGILFYHLKKLLKKNGVLFGSTVVNKGCNHNIFSYSINALFNWIGLLKNKNDSVAELEKALKAYFREVHIEVHGSTAIFSAR